MEKIVIQFEGPCLLYCAVCYTVMQNLRQLSQGQPLMRNLSLTPKNVQCSLNFDQQPMNVRSNVLIKIQRRIGNFQFRYTFLLKHK